MNCKYWKCKTQKLIFAFSPCFLGFYWPGAGNPCLCILSSCCVHPLWAAASQWWLYAKFLQRLHRSVRYLPPYLYQTKVRALLMDSVPKRHRGRWNSVESIFSFSFSGSAVLGGSDCSLLAESLRIFCLGGSSITIPTVSAFSWPDAFMLSLPDFWLPVLTVLIVSTNVDSCYRFFIFFLFYFFLIFQKFP